MTLPQSLELVLDLDAVDDESAHRLLAAQMLHVAPAHITAVRVRKRSVDARGKSIKVRLQVDVWCDEEAPDETAPRPDYRAIDGNRAVVIVGCGPAGMFAALRLIELGIKPIILERGKDVQARRRDLARLNREGIVDENSNYCFGEGGAGTYSDGTLYTRVKDKSRIARVLKTLVAHGAPPDILVDAHPHIGSNRLPQVVQAMRNSILEAGGEIRFQTRVVDLLLENNFVRGVKTQSGDEIQGDAVILATGHSARDIFELLQKRQVQIEAKPFAMGVRIEHPQPLIDRIQYRLAPSFPHMSTHVRRNRAPRNRNQNTQTALTATAETATAETATAQCANDDISNDDISNGGAAIGDVATSLAMKSGVEKNATLKSSTIANTTSAASAIAPGTSAMRAGEWRHPKLPAASYRLAATIEGRGVFSFCMCPGGWIVPAATGEAEVVVNGMSLSRRDSPFANSGLVVAVETEDLKAFESFGALAGIEYQKVLEKMAFDSGGGQSRAPAQRVVDFLAHRVSTSLPACSYRPGLTSVALHELLPPSIARRLQGGLGQFGKTMRGYLSPDALLIGVETRTSSPVRVPRDPQTLCHPQIENLYPCGEGAGYAGGIVSAAIDGERVGEACAARIEDR